MPRVRPESTVSQGARDLRRATRIVGFITFVMLCGSFAAYKGWLPRNLGLAFVDLFVAAGLATIWIGIKAHRKALEDRERESRGAMIIAIAVQLGKQDDASLEKVKSRGGPAGEAAGLILQGRAEKLKKVRGEG